MCSWVHVTWSTDKGNVCQSQRQGLGIYREIVYGKAGVRVEIGAMIGRAVHCDTSIPAGPRGGMNWSCRAGLVHDLLGLGPMRG